MSRVSHDSSWKQCHGVRNGPSNDKFQKNFIGEKVRTQQELEEYVLKEKLKNKSVYVQIREDFVEKEECDRDEDSKINIINVQKRNDFERREEENVYRKLKNKIKNVKRNGSDVKEKTKSNNIYVKISKEFPETDKNNVDKELKINDDVKNYITKEITSNKSGNIINRDVTNETQATKNDEKLKKCVIFLEELDTNYKINHEKNELVKEINSTNIENVSKYKYINKTKWDAVDKYEKTLSSFVSGRVKTYLKPRHKKIQKAICMKTFNSNALRTNDINVRSKWNLNSGVLISLIVLYVSGPSYAEDTTSFSSGLTSRMIASFLGYPSTCTLGNEVRPCSLTLSCWLRGGTRLRGCGGWLFSCCGPPEPSDTLSNSIPSSDWKYKPSPPVLRQVPQRNVMPNNVFRRRVDDDATQMDCGLPSSRILQKRIIGGREARFAEFPWQAHVRISEFQCGGVLVSRRYVATAAHCVSRAHTRDIAVWLGAIDTSATHHPARKLGVVQKILHPLFQFRMTQPDRYDIALLKLSRVITYMSHILPICLPDYDMDLRGRSGVIAGWGKTDASNGHTGTNLLRSATVPILSKEQCINWHQSKQISVEIHSEMICAGHSDGHQDACLGDSGGPLIVLDNGRYYLVGITSAGFGCGVDHQPGIYHNVKLTANWIRSVITPSVNYNDNYLK